LILLFIFSGFNFLPASFPSTMRLLTLLVTAAQACMVMAAPFSYPLANGFPKINVTSLEEIFKLAGGTTPNVSPLTSLKDGRVQTLQLIAANELLEIAFFTELLQNITSHVPGYETNQYNIDSLTAIVNVRSSYPPR
jgi:hypothetical protein